VKKRLPALRDVSVQAINRMVMETSDLKTLEGWMAEEKDGARRRSALHRIYHRFSQIRRDTEIAELNAFCEAGKVE